MSYFIDIDDDDLAYKGGVSLPLISRAIGLSVYLDL
jgi:hypothetical protein